jgi:hypothetical protein
MKESFNDFTSKYGGKVFVIFSLKEGIQNMDVLEKIKAEIARLKK